MKAQLSDLFIDGEHFTFTNVDYSSKETQNEIAELMREQDALTRSMDINLNELEKITFNI